jgi:hypothetical protein
MGNILCFKNQKVKVSVSETNYNYKCKYTSHNLIILQLH